MLLDNSSQPYLYKDSSDATCLLYCHAEQTLNLLFGNSFRIRPWKIRYRNLNSNFDEIIPTNRYQEGYGKVLVECNPHINLINNQLTLFYTAGFSNGRDTPIKYYYCAMDSEDYTFMNLSNFRIIQPTFTACIFNDKIIYIQKTQHSDKLMSKDYGSDNATEITVSGMDLIEIVRITKLFDQNKLIMTGRNPENIDTSYLINSDLHVEKAIKNIYNYNVYKCSLLDNQLAYTVKVNPHSDNEHRQIVLENIAE